MSWLLEVEGGLHPGASSRYPEYEDTSAVAQKNHDTKGVSLRGSRTTSLLDRMPVCSVPWESAATGYRDLWLPISTPGHYHVTYCATSVVSESHSP